MTYVRYFIEEARKATDPASRNLNLLDPEYFNLRTSMDIACNLKEWESVKLLVDNKAADGPLMCVAIGMIGKFL